MHRTMLVIFMLIFVGCNKSGPIDPNDGLNQEQIDIQEFISGIGDGAGSAAFKNKFTNAPSTAESKKYATLYFSASEIVINGNSATATVDISKPGEADPYATKTWKLKKEGDNWKLESAPLQ